MTPRLVLLGALLFASLAIGGTRYVGGGLQLGPAAPVYAPLTAPDAGVMVSQILYTQAELGFVANTRIVDVAWRKEGLGPSTGAGGCDVQVYLKNVPRQQALFTVGSTQTLADALRDAQKVIDRQGGALPSTMGFVTLDSTENNFDFTYTGDSLETTIVTDCRGAAAPVIDAALRWRFDVVNERVRTATAASTAEAILTAEPILSSWRPHTRFRTLSPTPGIELRVARNVLPNGGTFAVAPKHFADGLPAPFAFELVNLGQAPVELTAVTFGALQNGSATASVTAPVTIAPGASLPTPVSFTPVGTALARFSVSWVTSAGTQTNTFQGTPTATPEPQPSAALVKPDEALQTLTTPAVTTVQLGTVPPGHVVDQTVLAQNFGQGEVEAHVEVMSGEVEVLTPSTMVGTQQDVGLRTRTRAPAASGPFISEVRVAVGGTSYVIRETGTVAVPDLAVFVEGVEIPNGGQDHVLRPDAAPIQRRYAILNRGQAELHMPSGTMWVYSTVTGTFEASVPKVLPPGATVDATIQLPSYARYLEPFHCQLSSDDPQDYRFDWTVESLLAGRPLLVVRWSLLGGDPMTGELNGQAFRGQRKSSKSKDGVRVVMSNGGAWPLTISELGELCERCVGPEPLAGPLVLQPGEELARSFRADGTWLRLTYDIQSDDPDGAFPFFIESTTDMCSVSAGEAFLGLGLLLLLPRKRAQSR